MKKTRVISFVLALLMLISVIPLNEFVAEGSTAQTGSVTVRVEGYDSTVLNETEIPIASITSPAAISTTPTAINAISEALIGKDLAVDEKYGYIKSVDGLEELDSQFKNEVPDDYGSFNRSGWQYVVNNESPSTGVSSYELSDGDDIVLYYTEDYSNCSYAYFTEKSKEIDEGEYAELTLKTLHTDSETWITSAVPLQDAYIVIDGVLTENKTDATGKVNIKFDEPGEHLITAKKLVDIGLTSGKEVDTIDGNPSCEIKVYEKVPKLKSIAFSNSTTATDSEVLPLEYEDGTYTLYRPDYVTSGYGYAKAEEVNPSHKVWVVTKTPWGGNVISDPISATTWTSIKNTPAMLTQFGNFTVHVGPGETALSEENTVYTFNGVVIPTLKALALTENETMFPAFAPATTAYTAYVPYDAEIVAIAATGYASNYTITVNGEAATSIAPHWDDQGQMMADIKVSNSKADKTYTITLIREPRADMPFFSLQPKDASYLDTKTGSPLKVRASASGTLSYQWYSNAVNSSEGGTPITDATSESYAPVISDLGKTQLKQEYYYCVVTNTIDGGSQYTAASQVATITTTPDPTPAVTLVQADGTALPEEGFTYDINSTPTNLKVITDSDAEGGTWSYKWKRNSSTAPNSTNADICTPQTSKVGEYTYWCSVTYTVGSVAYTTSSSKVAITILTTSAADPVISTHPVGAEYFVNSASITSLSAAANAPDGGKITYQWQNSSDGTTYTNIEGATANTYLPVTASEAGNVYYRCAFINTVTSGGNTYTATVYSNPAVITFIMPLWEGAGTQDSPYLLQKVEDMTKLQEYANIKGQVFTGTYFNMTADITLPMDWTPLGIKLKPFAGYFDGGGNLLTVPKDGLPLFGYTKGATLSNLNIYGEKIAGYGVVNNYEIGFTISIDGVTLKSGTKTLKSGFIGGYASGSNTITIRNCTVEEGVVIGYDQTQSHIGSFGGEYNGTIENCISFATVYGKDFVGGLVGNKGQTMGLFTIKNSIFAGSIIATGDCVGGIAGGGYGGSEWGLGTAPNTPAVTIQNCYVTGSITGSNNVGGILGAEAGLVQCWSNGIGYIQNNHFSGQISATASNAYIGGIIGYINGIDKYNIITNNYYLNTCGADTWIGHITYVDTSCTTVDKTAVGVTCYNTSDGKGGYPAGATFANHNRTDDSLGADADKFGKAVTEAALKDGSIVALLNAGENSYHNWIQGTTYPEISSKPIAYELSLSGDYKTEYTVGESFSSDNMVITAKYSDDTNKILTSDQVTFQGFDSSTSGAKTIIVKYGAVVAEYTVQVTLPNPGSATITVYFSLLGDHIHDSDTDGVVHTLKNGNLTTWLAKTPYEVSINATVLDVFSEALTAAGALWSNPSGNYIESITYNGVTLAEFTNGANSGWMYTLNGTHPDLGVEQQHLESNDMIVFHYTDDYTKEKGSEKWNGGTTGNSSGSSDEISLTPTAKISDGTAKVSLSLADMKDAIVASKSNSGDIVVTPVISGGINKVNAVLAKDALFAVAGQTSADLIVQTPVGNITLPNTTLDSIAEQAKGSNVIISLEIAETSSLTTAQQAVVGDSHVYDISVMSNGNHISSFDSGSITISLPYTLAEGEAADGVEVWYLNDAGELERISCTYDEITKLATFNTTHLSYYLVSYNASDVWTNPFLDVSDIDWYYDAMKYVSQNNLMKGTSSTTFEPNVLMNRAMLVTVLYRLEGSPAATGINSFTDVRNDQWYTDAIIWANNNSIVSGYSGLFGTEDSITREQLAMILYNYAKYKGYDVTAEKDLTAYTDADSISVWAAAAMKWAVSEELITGTTTTKLAPSGSASRSQVATILMRFCENIVK